MLRTANKAVIIASAVTLVIAFVNRNDIPGAIDFHPKLEDEPRQRPIAQAPMTVPYAGVDYRVEPLFSYELYGLVVSYRQHDGESSMHRWSNDHLNMADVCVVWSDTAFSPTLQKLKFWNGIFTCNVQTRDSVAWSQFKMNQLSNNHLISADEYIRDRVGEIRVGDQIRIKGSLVRYGADKRRLARDEHDARRHRRRGVRDDSRRRVRSRAAGLESLALGDVRRACAPRGVARSALRASLSAVSRLIRCA